MKQHALVMKMRGMFSVNGHFTVIVRIRIKDRWEFESSGSKVMVWGDFAVDRKCDSVHRLTHRSK